MNTDNTNRDAEPSPASAGSVANSQATLDGWIPVSERCPAKHLMVLVWSQSDGLHLARLDLWGQWRDADENFGKKITHWMQLPAPPTARK
jgi:hypothetical protein